MEEKVLYFGYGANREPAMMEAITGNANLVGKPAVLRGYELCVQRLDQVPDIPRRILDASWSPKFTSYTIRTGAPDDEVYGTLWELTPLERELVRNWELIDLGWYRDMQVKITTEDGQEIEARTEGLREGLEIDREVDGREYKSFLNRL